MLEERQRKCMESAVSAWSALLVLWERCECLEGALELRN